MLGGVKAHYDCINAFSETDFTEHLKKIDILSLSATVTTTRSFPSAPLLFSPQSCSRTPAQGLSRLSARHGHHSR
jgi:hypothetical protein